MTKVWLVGGILILAGIATVALGQMFQEKPCCTESDDNRWTTNF